MLKVIIIEDEIPAQNKLVRLLEKVAPDALVIDKIDNVAELSSRLKDGLLADLIISDIELRDGQVFEAYQQYPTTVPIIFATAYDSFWMEAFEGSGIAYLLKPFSLDNFQKAFAKFMSLREQMVPSQQQLFEQLSHLVHSSHKPKKNYKDYLSIKSGTSVYFLKVDEIVFLKAEEGLIYAFDRAGKKHILNQSSLKVLLEESLDPDEFFKINRSEVLQRKYIEQIDRYGKHTVAIKLLHHQLITSERTTAAFHKWLDL